MLTQYAQKLIAEKYGKPKPPPTKRKYSRPQKRAFQERIQAMDADTLKKGPRFNGLSKRKAKDERALGKFIRNKQFATLKGKEKFVAGTKLSATWVKKRP